MGICAIGDEDMINGKKIIAFCTTRINAKLNFELIESLGANAGKIGAKLLVYTTCLDLFWGRDNEKGEASIFNLMDFDIIDVVVLLNQEIKSKEVIDAIIERAHNKNVPVITLDAHIDGCVNVYFDYEHGMEKVIRHVIEDHHVTKLHFLSGFRNHELSENRVEVFKRVLRDKGIEFSDDMVSYGEFWAVPAEAAAQALVDSGRVPEAVICANDTMAISVCKVLKHNGYRVPEDVIVTGFDGIEDIYFSNPQITSCECRYADMGKRICELIPDIVDRKIVEGDFSIEPRLIIFKSCGCSYGTAMDVSEYLMDFHTRFFELQDNEHTFAELPSRVQMADSIEAAAEAFDKKRIKDVACFLTDKSVNEQINPTEWDGDSSFGDEVVLLFDSDKMCPEGERYVPSIFNVKDIAPNIDKKFEDDYPIIFLSLYLLKAPMGYLSFHFYDSDYINYIKIPQVVAAINNAIFGLRNMRYQKYLMAKLNEMYSTDQLTGLSNRTSFSMAYGEMLRHRQSGSKLVVALADLDGLKGINDNYGHTEGDNAICVEARALRNAFPHEALFVRFGGDEMAAVTEAQVEPEEIKAEFMKYFDDYNRTSGKPYNVSASLGIYTVQDGESVEFEMLIKKVDRLMYEEKRIRHS